MDAYIRWTFMPVLHTNGLLTLFIVVSMPLIVAP
jgi:hypothetical protein